MPAIKRLVMKGFKSFAKRTELDFSSNFAVVLGPNGSGKSNVTDAICFALGTSSAKTLRAESSAKLIYHGGEKGSPAKEAEVSVVFANEGKAFPFEGEEFTVSRILKHSGQSTYKLNGKTVTRQQILDLLAAGRINPDGHNIILQGEITHFSEMRSNDRRMIIEEIAGISVYEDKKTKALLELQHVQEKLNEAEIILAERQKTLNELKADRDSAMQFREKEDTLTRNKATRASLQIGDMASKKDEAEKRKAGIQKEVDRLNLEIEELKNDAETKKARIQEIIKHIEERSGVEQKDISNKVETTKGEIARKQARKEVCEAEVGKLTQRKKSLESEIKAIEARIKELEGKKQIAANRIGIFDSDEKSMQAKIDTWKKKHGISDAEECNKRIGEIEKEEEGLSKTAFDLNQKKMDAQRKKEVSQIELNGVNAKIKEIEEEIHKDKEKFAQLKLKREEFRNVVQTLTKALNESSVFASQLADARKNYDGENEKLAKLKARAIGIRENAAADIALQKIREANIDGVIGLVSELGTVSSKYAMALEVAASQRLKSVVVNTDSTAAKCISYLRENKLGVVTFLPMNKMQEPVVEADAEKAAKEKGVIGFAASLVSFEPKYKNVFRYVFGSTLIVEDMATARRIGIGRARMATLEGDIAERSGAMTGGFRMRKTGMGFREKELEHDLENSEKDAGSLIQMVNMLEEKKTKNEEEISSLRERKVALETELKLAGDSEEVSSDLKKLGEQKGGFEKHLLDFAKEFEESDKSLKAATNSVEKLRAEKNALREKITKAGKASMEELSKLEEELRQAKENKMKEEGASSTIDMQVGIQKQELQKVKGIIGQNERAKEGFYNEIKQLGEELSKEKDLLKGLEATQKKIASEFQKMFREKDELKDKFAKIEGKIIGKEENLRHTEEKKNEYSVKIAEISGSVAGLEKEFEQYASVQLRRGLTIEQLNAEITAIERELKAMGNINMRALEVYEKANEECKNLLEKHEKLKIEKEDVLNMMMSIEEKKKGAFMEVFDKLKQNFQRIFSSLTTKGEVNLVIENAENPFEGGVDITVRVGSNKFVDIIGFSGGEKTLAALAFLFAIQEFNPAPFYVMDEVDAALDKMNSDMLSKLLAAYSGKSQYIVISHNDGVISAADSVYGVSLPKDGYGMSKVVSLKI
ncbi:MAG: chromosome segregation protein SMC [Nanoarchaeota archaeon]|nr:chromosome segregation protein SMC [Nanoarchaeota archaeon]